MNNNPPKQAVILAGGMGTRLRPITNTIPKPMIRFNGKPFLEYLIEQLKDQGIERVLLLLGYLPDVVQNYFGNGESFGMQINYSVTDIDNETGKRIKLAAKDLDPYFLLLYCDNYWPMNLKKMWEQFLEAEASAQITVYSNKDNYTKHNVLVNGNAMVAEYDKSRTSNNLEGVDIGYALINKKVLDSLPSENVNFEKAVYPVLVDKGQLSAYVSNHRYYSVGSHERLPLTDSFLKRKPAIILDRDGVLNKKAPKAEYVKSWQEFEWLPGAKEAICLLKKTGYKIIIVTNQAGIARGMMTETDLSDIHTMIKEDLAKDGTVIDALYHCPHGWNDGCDCRKPKPGMLFQAQKDFNLDLTRTYFIGDDIRDKQAGDAAGCETLLISSKESLLQVVKQNILQ